jgi:hypothetical protein
MSKTTIKADTSSKQGNVLDAVVVQEEEEVIKENNGIGNALSPNKVKMKKIGFRRVAKNGQVRYIRLFQFHQFLVTLKM